MSEMCYNIIVYNVLGTSPCQVVQSWTSASVLISEASLYHVSAGIRLVTLHDASTKNAGPILAMWQFNSFSPPPPPSFASCIILNETMPLLS